MDVVVWLWSLGLEQYEAAFRENAVDETVLPKLTAEDLRDLGVTAVGHRRKRLEAIAELRRSLAESSDRLDNAWTQMLQTLRIERVALAANIASERESLETTADVERARISADASKIAERAVDKSWSEIRALVREALLLLIVLAVVVLGLPFAAGYFLGRHRAASNRNRDGV